MRFFADAGVDVVDGVGGRDDGRVGDGRGNGHGGEVGEEYVGDTGGVDCVGDGERFRRCCGTFRTCAEDVGVVGDVAEMAVMEILTLSCALFDVLLRVNGG